MTSFRTSAIVALLAAAPAPAIAHAALVHADPSVGGTIAAAPSQVTLSFSEDVVPGLCSVVVQDAAGHNVSVAKASGNGASLRVPLAGHLTAGRYTVIWHAVSTDSHKTQGRFGFTFAP